MNRAMQDQPEEAASGALAPDAVASGHGSRSTAAPENGVRKAGKDPAAGSNRSSSVLLVLGMIVMFLGLFHIVWDDGLHVIPKKNFTFCLTFSHLSHITSDYRNRPNLDAFNDDEHLNHLVRELVRRKVIHVKKS